MSKKYRVEPTRNVTRKGEYLVQLNLKHAPHQINTKYLLLRNDRGMEIQAAYQHNDQLDENTLYVDQTLRYALGIDAGEHLFVSPMTEHVRQELYRRIGRWLLGVQVNMVRVHQASYNDMEIDLCRITRESLQSINADDGDFIIVESPKKRIKIRALQMTPKIIDEVRERSKRDRDKYHNCEEHLDMGRLDGNPLDLPPILIDLDARLKLGVRECDPVRIYRSLSHNAGKRLHLISIPLILALIASLVSFEFSSACKSLILVFGFITILIFTFIDMRIK
jgi:hypothetical protein